APGGGVTGGEGGVHGGNRARALAVPAPEPWKEGSQDQEESEEQQDPGDPLDDRPRQVQHPGAPQNDVEQDLLQESRELANIGALGGYGSALHAALRQHALHQDTVCRHDPLAAEGGSGGQHGKEEGEQGSQSGSTPGGGEAGNIVSISE